MLVLAAAMSIDWASAETVAIIATEYRFDPSSLTFRIAVPYRLHLENRGKELHDFTAPAFFKSVHLRNPAAPNQVPTDIVLQPGEQRDLYFVPEQAGHYPFFCADHGWAGMTGEIVVQ